MPKDKSGTTRKVNPETVEFKQRFIERFSALTDFAEFREYSLKFLRRSIRVNTIKAKVSGIKERLSREWVLEQVPWCREGFWIEHKGEGGEKRRDIGNLREHSLGYVYVQEAASMIPPVVLEPQPGEAILDMCAAPGSKSSQLAMYMRNTGVLVCNDYAGLRMAPLGINLQRMGASNTIITMMHGQQFPKTGIEFDRVLVDAPCSGTGTIRKSLKTIVIWNPGMIRRLSVTQKQLIEAGFLCLKRGGTMVYSTCSVEPEENEAVVSYLLGKYPEAELCDISLKLKSSPAIIKFQGNEFRPEVKKCLRLWPQDNDTEGFFVAKIRKQ